MSQNWHLKGFSMSSSDLDEVGYFFVGTFLDFPTLLTTLLIFMDFSWGLERSATSSFSTNLCFLLAYFVGFDAVYFLIRKDLLSICRDFASLNSLVLRIFYKSIFKVLDFYLFLNRIFPFFGSVTPVLGVASFTVSWDGVIASDALVSQDIDKVLKHILTIAFGWTKLLRIATLLSNY